MLKQILQRAQLKNLYKSNQTPNANTKSKLISNNLAILKNVGLKYAGDIQKANLNFELRATANQWIWNWYSRRQTSTYSECK